MVLLVVFLEGLMTFFSPCHLPVLSAYYLYLLGNNDRKYSSFLHSLFIMLGFNAVFILIGYIIFKLGSQVPEDIFAMISGVVIVLLGILYLIPSKHHHHSHECMEHDIEHTHDDCHCDCHHHFIEEKLSLSKRFAHSSRSIWRSILFGCGIAISLSGCSSYIIVGIIGTAISSSFGFLVMLVFCIGISLPFILSALLYDRIKPILNGLQKHERTIRLISGILLILLGILIGLNVFETLFHQHAH